ncbi:MAG: TolC family protein [Siphonobacter sp.]
MFRKIALLIGCFASTFSLFAQSTPQVLTLEQAILTALERNYSIKIARNQVRLAENDNTRGNAGMLPIITGTAQPSGTLNSTNQKYFDGARAPLVQRGVLNRNFVATVQLTWTLFNGLSMYITKEKLNELVKAGDAQAQVTIESTIANVASMYYAVMQQEQQTRSLEDALAISRERRRLAKDQYEIGQGAKVLYLNAQVDFNADTAALISQRLTLRNTKTQLNQALIQTLDTDFQTADTIKLNRDMVYETLKDQTLQQNPAIILARYNTNIARLEIRNQEALLWPILDFVSSYGYTGLRNGGSGFGVQSGRSANLIAGLRVTAPIFDGFNQRRRIQGARISEEITRQQQEDQTVQIESALSQTYRTYRNNLDLVDLEARNVEVAKQNVTISFDRYKIGVAAPIELREAQRNLVATQARLFQAQYNAKVSEIELLRLSSQIMK